MKKLISATLAASLALSLAACGSSASTDSVAASSEAASTESTAASSEAAESTAETTEEMIAEGRRLAALAPNIVVKLPICEASLPATHTLAKEGVRVNMTLVFSAPQALLAARAGARYISPFVGRFDDIGDDGLSQLETVVEAVKNFDYGYWEQEGGPEIITASVRTPNHVTQAALMGADIATVPFGALKKCVHHPLTDKGLEGFAADWAKVVAAQ